MKEAKTKARPFDRETAAKAKMLAEIGFEISVIAEKLGYSESAMRKLSRDGYDLDRYLERKKAENKAQQERKDREAEPAEENPAEEQVPGQIEMDLEAAKPEKAEMSDQTKMMRFIAGQMDKMNTMIALGMDALRIQIDRLNDTLCMILRAVRNE